jgi:predicted DNA-binding mobile mystery protein A
MKVTSQAVQELERNEINETIKLETLRRVAMALNCELVYALIPRTSLDDFVMRQARQLAIGHLSRVAHQSLLEDQEVAQDDIEEQLDEITSKMIQSRRLWSEDPLQ